jgi:hypothetical protein
MKKLLFVLMISLVLVACKKDDPEPVIEIEGIVGSWKYVATEKIVNEIPTWVAVNGEPNVTFRQDGVILDSKLGGPSCCAPRAYTVNGLWFKIKNETAQEISQKCGPVDCVGGACAPTHTWNMLQSGDELIIISGCNPNMKWSKYIRE